jgi:hypothetical protein
VASAQRYFAFCTLHPAEFFAYSVQHYTGAGGSAAQRVDPPAQQPVLCYQSRALCLQQQQPQRLLTKRDTVMATAILTGYNHRAAYVQRLQRVQKSLDTSTDP